ncbi:hypothetical protein ACFL1H_04175 [Nanoarchaeota archaeon]
MAEPTQEEKNLFNPEKEGGEPMPGQPPVGNPADMPPPGPELPPTPGSMPPPPPKKSGGLFASKPPVPTINVAEFHEDINNISRRMRMIEERYTRTRDKIRLNEENMLNSNKKLFEDIKSINADITDMKHRMEELKNDLSMITSDLRNTAKAEDLLSLKKYVNVWEPINFVTQNEVEKIVDFVVEQKLKENKN